MERESKEKGRGREKKRRERGGKEWMISKGGGEWTRIEGTKMKVKKKRKIQERGMRKGTGDD